MQGEFEQRDVLCSHAKAKTNWPDEFRESILAPTSRKTESPCRPFDFRWWAWNDHGLGALVLKEAKEQREDWSLRMSKYQKVTKFG